MIVPEQATLQAEQRLLALHPGHVLFNIDVLSFNRLAYRVFEELGIADPDILSEVGKSMMLRRAAAKHADELTIFRNNLKKQGFIHHLKSLLTELVSYNISLEDLEAFM